MKIGVANGLEKSLPSGRRIEARLSNPPPPSSADVSGERGEGGFPAEGGGSGGGHKLKDSFWRAKELEDLEKNASYFVSLQAASAAAVLPDQRIIFLFFFSQYLWRSMALLKQILPSHIKNNMK